MNNQRWMETTTPRPNIDSLPVINDDRFRQRSFNRFKSEGSFPTVTGTTTLATPLMEANVDLSSMRDGMSFEQQHQQKRFGE